MPSSIPALRFCKRSSSASSTSTASPLSDMSPAMPSPNPCTIPNCTVGSYPSHLTNSRASLLTIHRLTPWTFITSWNFFAIVPSSSSISRVALKTFSRSYIWVTRLMDCRLVLRSLSYESAVAMAWVASSGISPSISNNPSEIG